MEKDEAKRGISRREFLKDAGLVVGGAAVGAAITYPLVPKEVVKEVEVIKEVEVTKYKCPYCGVTLDTFDALKAHITAQHPVEAIPEEVPMYVCPYCRAELDTFDALKAHVDTEHPPEVVPEEPVKSVIRGLGSGNFGRDSAPARVDVRGGKILRIRPIHLEDEGFSKEYMKPYRIEVDGKVLEMPLKSTHSPCGISYKKRVYSPNRVKYPLKRVDWEPGGVNVNPQNRGKSKYKRISWDEATDIIASEIKRIHDKYGVLAILAQADGHGEGKVVHGPHGCQTQLLRWMGPDIQHSYTLQIRTPDSWEGYYWGAKHMWGGEMVGTKAPSHRYKILDCVEDIELVIWTKDEERTTGGSKGHGSCSNKTLWWKSLGRAKNILLAPDFNYTAAAHDFKWIPVTHGLGDGALHLAMQYIWITEGTYDKEYIAKATVGFDKYKAHVLGEDDGVPKTPEWAAPRCGIPVWHIKALARQWAAKRTTVTGCCGAMMRAPYATEPVRQYIATLVMQGVNSRGRIQSSPVTGTPSQRAQSASFDRGRNPDLAARGLEEHEIAKDEMRPAQFIPKTLIPSAIVNPPLTWYGVASPWRLASDQGNIYTYPIPAEEGGTDIHMIWTDTPCWTTCWNGGHRYMAALQDPKIEFVLTEHPWLEDDTLLSDIILPTTTRFEEYDIGVASASEGWRCLYMVKHCIDPIGESKTDYEVSLEVAKKLEEYGGRYAGIVNKYTWGNSVEDWIKVGYRVQECERKTGLTYEQFKEEDLFVWPSADYTEADLRRKPDVTNSYDDIEANPLQTPTGKYEFESQFLLEKFPDDEERPPASKWVVGGPGWTHDEWIEGEKAKTYPLLLQSLHPKWRSMHAQADDIAWVREIPRCKVKGPDGYLYEPLWINPVDAAPRGIKDGDVVSIYNETGTVLGGAYVTGRIIPGTVYQDHGARVDPIVAGPDEWIDRGGANNLICRLEPLSQNAIGQICSAFLVQVDKTDLAALRAKYPEAFAREYDPASGLCFNSWVEGGE